MPFLIDSKIPRRQFLRTTMQGAGALATLSSVFNKPVFAEEQENTRWAFLSDIHVPRDPSNEYRGFRPYDNMKKVVDEVVTANPEGALITGDLARLEGFAGDYAMLKTLIDPIHQAMPLAMTLGNHDDRGNFLNAFNQHPGIQDVSGKHTLVIEKGPVRLILLDSLLYTNKVAGLLGKTQRDWLRVFLSQAKPKPTLLFFHHTLSDNDGSLLDVERLFSLIVPSNQIKAIVYGHSHEYAYQERMGIHLINLPAVAYNFNDRDPIGWIETTLTAKGGAFTLHAIGGNTEKNGETTQVTWRA